MLMPIIPALASKFFWLIEALFSTKIMYHSFKILVRKRFSDFFFSDFLVLRGGLEVEQKAKGLGS